MNSINKHMAQSKIKILKFKDFKKIDKKDQFYQKRVNINQIKIPKVWDQESNILRNSDGHYLETIYNMENLKRVKQQGKLQKKGKILINHILINTIYIFIIDIQKMKKLITSVLN